PLGLGAQSMRWVSAAARMERSPLIARTDGSVILILRPDLAKLPREPGDREPHSGKKSPEPSVAAAAGGLIGVRVGRRGESVEREPQADARKHDGENRCQPDRNLHFSLYPAAHGVLVFEVLGTEPPFEILLLSRDHYKDHDRVRRDEGRDQPQAVDPDCNPQVQKREREVDRVAAEAI